MKHDCHIFRHTSEIICKCDELARSIFEDFKMQVRKRKGDLAMKDSKNQDLKRSYEHELDKGLKEIIKDAEIELEKHLKRISKG